MKTNSVRLRATLITTLALAALVLPASLFAHCDTMDGPVVQAAKVALESKDITPVLKWLKPDGEAEVQAAFNKTLAVRAKGPDARQLADQFFFETLVRVHRAAEGAPYTGLKPAGTPLPPPIREADNALETGSTEKVVKLVTDEAAAGIRKRFTDAHEKKAHADHNVEAGRDFVAAYVEYVHYVEGLHNAAQTGGGHHETQEPQTPDRQAHNHSVTKHNH